MLFANPTRKKAIAYYRHSAEDKQENSVPIQREQAEQFSLTHNIELIHEEADEGVSGLTEHRPGFQRLISDWILRLDAPLFDYVIVYDVSRWGRFQDPNQAAYYEYLCTKKGVRVIYIDRGFPKAEEDLSNNLITNIDRYMAAQYSRVLSTKVFHGSVKVSQAGYSAGGMAPYGLARLLLDENKKPIGILKRGEHKVISNQRVTYVPANDDTTKTVKQIFNLLTKSWRTPKEIAEVLNSEGKVSVTGRPWDRDKVVRILTNQTYTGSMVYNKTWGRLKQKKRVNPKTDWVICPNAFEAVIKPEQFARAQEHLYWLLPYKWKRGVYSIRKAKRLIAQQLIQAVADQENHTVDREWEIRQKLPLLFGVTYYRGLVPHWCFCITEPQRNQETVLAMGIDVLGGETAEKFFNLPTSAFGKNNYLLLSEDDPSYRDFVLSSHQAEEQLLEACNNTVI